MVINALPDATGFAQRLSDLDTAVDALVVNQAATRMALMTAQGDLTTQQGEVNDANTAVTDLNTAVMGVMGDIDQNATDLSDLQMAITMAEDAVDDLAPDVDVFLTNASTITWDNGNNDLDGTSGKPDSNQCVDMGQTVQFYLSMTSTFVVGTPNGEVLDVQLLASNTLGTDVVVA